MKRSLARKLLLLLFVVAAGSNGFAQTHFKYKARLNNVGQSGFYNISLSPSIIAKCKNELEDLRVKDDNGTEAPYLLYTESAQPNEDAFTEFPLSYSNDRKTIYINNILPNSLDKLFLLIKNSEAQRLATLSGSDDTSHWFVIKEDIILQNEYTADSDTFVQSVSFPKSSYKYFRITMPGKNVLPLNIVKAGVYRHSFTSNIYDTLPAPFIVQKDSSDKKSYVYLSFPDSYVIDKLLLSFSGSKYYKRLIALYDKNSVHTSLAIDTVSSVKPAGIDFHAKTNRLLLVIDNRDNAPLSVQGIIALGLHTSVTAYLENNKHYALYFGDSSVMAPSYDLQYFNDSIGSNILAAQAGRIEKINAPSTVEVKKSEWNKWILWGIIIAVLGLLLYFSLRMISDINHKKDGNTHL